MYSKGYLPTAKNSHKTVVEFTRLTLGDEYHSLIGKFNRMRRQRHDFIYETKNHITSQEAKSSLESAKKLIDKIIAMVKQDNPQMGLF